MSEQSTQYLQPSPMECLQEIAVAISRMRRGRPWGTTEETRQWDICIELMETAYARFAQFVAMKRDSEIDAERLYESYRDAVREMFGIVTEPWSALSDDMKAMWGNVSAGAGGRNGQV